MKTVKTNITKNSKGKNQVEFWTSVEVETQADVHVSVPLDEVIDDIIEALDPLQAEQIIEKAGLIGKKELEGVALRRHLCEITGLAYTSDKSRIVDELMSKL